VVRSGVVGSGFWVVDRGRLGMIRSGSGSMVGSGLGGVIGSRLGMVGSWCGFGVIGLIVGLTLVLDVSDVAVFVVGGVGDDLSSAIGKSHAVLSVDDTVVVLGFLLGKVGTRVFVFDTIFVGERPRGQFVLGGVVHWFVDRWVIWSRFWGVIWSGDGGMIGSRGVIGGGVIWSRGVIGADVGQGQGQGRG